MTKHSMLSTIDNPWNPFDDYTAWAAWDMSHGYNSSSLLAYVAAVSYETTTAKELEAIEEAIDEIVSENVSGMHIKVTRELPDPPEFKPE